MKKTAVILVNTGTPDTPSVPDVERFLVEFLGDGRVITLPWLPRKILVNGIISPFRAPRSAKLYKRLWTPRGSPLLFHLNSLTAQTQSKLGSDYTVFPAMRYGNPSLASALEKIREEQFDAINILPLFPQYASSTTGSIAERVMKIMKQWEVMPEVKIIGQFYHFKGFQDAYVQNIRNMKPDTYDHIIFSYHSLPLSHLEKTHPGYTCEELKCHQKVSTHNSHCYKATCFATSKLLAEQAGILEKNYTVTFQSRFSRNWLGPFADKIVEEKALEGIKKMLVISPAFVADCLETIVEIGYEYREIFTVNGGEILDLCPSLNESSIWVEAVADLVR